MAVFADSRRDLDVCGPTARELWRVGLFAALLTAMAFTAFHGVGIATGADLFFTHDIGGSDIWHLNYPMRHFLRQELAEGRLPLWSPEVGTGYPLHAEGQIGALYPVNLALAPLPLALGLNWGMLLHAALSGAFAAAFARQLGAARGASLVAAIAFAFSGFFVAHVKHTNMTASAVYIPLLLLLLERYAHRRSTVTLVCFAAATACMTLAGHPQIVYNNLRDPAARESRRAAARPAGSRGPGGARASIRLRTQARGAAHRRPARHRGPRVRPASRGAATSGSRGARARASVHAGDPITAPVKFAEYGPQRIRLEVEAPKECWLFMSDTYYPGWVAAVDGSETPIIRANLTGRAVEVPAGRHEVVFTFAPTSLRNGFLLALAGLVLLATVALQARLIERFTRR